MASNRIDDKKIANENQISYAWFSYADYVKGLLYFEGPVDKQHPTGVYELDGNLNVFKILKKNFLYPKSDFIIRDYNYLILQGNNPLNAIGFSVITDEDIYCSMKLNLDNQLNQSLLKWALEKFGKDYQFKTNKIRTEINLSDKQTIKFLEEFGFEKQYEILSEGTVVLYLNILPTEYLVFTKLSYLNNIFYKYEKQSFVEIVNSTILSDITQFRKAFCKGNLSEISVIQIINNSIKVLIGIDNKEDMFEIDQLCASKNIDLLDVFKVLLLALSSKEKLNFSDHKKVSISLNINKDLEVKETLEKVGFQVVQFKNNEVKLECSLPWSSEILNITTLKIGNKYKSIAENPKIYSDYPSLSKWRDEHLVNLSYCIASFFNYISMERREQGFVEVKQTNDGSLSVNPIISYQQVNYVLSEIFPCGDMLKENNYTITPIPDEIAVAIKETISENINNKSLLTQQGKTELNAKINIEQRALQLIWNYLSNGINTLFYLDNVGINSNTEIEYKIKLAQLKGFNRRFTSQNYGFQLDIQNCVFQAILYVCVALVDWLETSRIGYDEVLTAFKILVPESRQAKLPSPSKEINADDIYVKIISNAIIERELTPLSEGINLILFILKWFTEKLKNPDNEDNFKTISRFMIFSNPV
jgi:hypothetical protein